MKLDGAWMIKNSFPYLFLIYYLVHWFIEFEYPIKFSYFSFKRKSFVSWFALYMTLCDISIIPFIEPENGGPVMEPSTKWIFAYYFLKLTISINLYVMENFVYYTIWISILSTVLLVLFELVHRRRSLLFISIAIFLMQFNLFSFFTKFFLKTEPHDSIPPLIYSTLMLIHFIAFIKNNMRPAEAGLRTWIMMSILLFTQFYILWNNNLSYLATLANSYGALTFIHSVYAIISRSVISAQITVLYFSVFVFLLTYSWNEIRKTDKWVYFSISVSSFAIFVILQIRNNLAVLGRFISENVDLLNLLFAFALTSFLQDYYEFQWKFIVAITLYPLALMQVFFLSTILLKIFKAPYTPSITYFFLSIICIALFFVHMFINDSEKSYVFYYQNLALSLIMFVYIVQQDNHEEKLDADGAIIMGELQSDQLKNSVYIEGMVLREEECCVCMVPFKQNDSIRTHINCENTYHEVCIWDWVVNNYYHKCPIC